MSATPSPPCAPNAIPSAPFAESGASWAKLDTPSRIQTLAERFLPNLQPAKPTQFSNFDHLPPRPPALPPAAGGDALSTMSASGNADITGSLPAKR